MNPWTTLVVRLSGVIGVVICFLVIAWCIKKSIHKRNDSWEKYLKEECEANATVQASFPFQLLLTIEWDKIPLSVSEKGKTCYQSLLTFQTRKMLYLKGRSNTEVKKQYGINFFSELLQYEETFYQFIRQLITYGDLLDEEGLKAESVCVYEMVASFDYETRKTNQKLQTYYQTTGDTFKLKMLKEHMESQC